MKAIVITITTCARTVSIRLLLFVFLAGCTSFWVVDCSHIAIGISALELEWALTANQRLFCDLRLHL